MSAPIFISYSSKDRSIAETICQALEARGQSCWIACRDVRAGENFQEAIVRALRSARVMLLVFSSNANNSEEIKKELVLAGRHHVTVVPARVEDVVPNDAFSYELATRQWVDLFQDWEREIEQLSAQLSHILETAESGNAAAIKTSAIPTSKRPSSNFPLIIGLALAILLLAIAGAALYLKSGEHASPAPVAMKAPAPVTAPTPSAAPLQPAQLATQAPPAAPAAPAPAAHPSAAAHVAHAAAAARATSASPPQAVATAQPAPPPPSAIAPAPEPAANPDDAAWQTAVTAGTRTGFAEYVKNFAAGSHAQEAQLRIADLILNAPPTGASFDGTWQTTWTCPNLGQYAGYSYRFAGQFKDGAYHGLKGVKGEPSSMALDGKIESDGVAAFYGEVIVGSPITGLGAARGTPSDFHALAQFEHSGGMGKRIEGRACTLAFERQ